MKTKYLLILAFIILISACKEEKKEKPSIINDQTSESYKSVADSTKATSLIDKCIEAHGGIEQWNSFLALNYTVTEEGRAVTQLTNLKNRKAYLISEDFEVGFDGEVAWAKPNASKIPGKSPSFYYNLDFYFIGIPFLLKDPGVITTDEGKSKINGNPYETLKITFDSQIGLSPEDVYYLYINPDTYRLEILTYSVSFFKGGDATINTAKIYSDYVETQGLIMPSKMENYEWKDNNLGESKGHIRHFNDIHFLKEIENQSVFEAPKGALKEKVN